MIAAAGIVIAGDTWAIKTTSFTNAAAKAPASVSPAFAAAHIAFGHAVAGTARGCVWPPSAITTKWRSSSLDDEDVHFIQWLRFLPGMSTDEAWRNFAATTSPAFICRPCV